MFENFIIHDSPIKKTKEPPNLCMLRDAQQRPDGIC
nr:MAG TPA: hypothetical protein [Caudoviricetes sp.]